MDTYKYIYFSSGGGMRLQVKPLFIFLIFLFPTVNIA